jgi:hypothetical protein
MFSLLPTYILVWKISAVSVAVFLGFLFLRFERRLTLKFFLFHLSISGTVWGILSVLGMITNNANNLNIPFPWVVMILIFSAASIFLTISLLFREILGDVCFNKKRWDLILFCVALYFLLVPISNQAPLTKDPIGYGWGMVFFALLAIVLFRMRLRLVRFGNRIQIRLISDLVKFARWTLLLFLPFFGFDLFAYFFQRTTGWIPVGLFFIVAFHFVLNFGIIALVANYGLKRMRLRTFLDRKRFSAEEYQLMDASFRYVDSATVMAVLGLSDTMFRRRLNAVYGRVGSRGDMTYLMKLLGRTEL